MNSSSSSLFLLRHKSRFVNSFFDFPNFSIISYQSISNPYFEVLRWRPKGKTLKTAATALKKKVGKRGKSFTPDSTGRKPAGSAHGSKRTADKVWKEATAAAILRAVGAVKVGAASSINVIDPAGSLTIVTGKTKK